MRLDYKWQAALITALGLFMAVLDNTIVSVALPQMADAFHTDTATIAWVATAYFLAQAAVIPMTGYLSDRSARSRLSSALAVFTIGSGLCAIAPGDTGLMGFRVFQGIGGGALFPIVFTMVYRLFPPTDRGPASAVIGVPILLAPAFGPTIGGYLTTTFDWSAIFTINLPLGVMPSFSRRCCCVAPGRPRRVGRGARPGKKLRCWGWCWRWGALRPWSMASPKPGRAAWATAVCRLSGPRHRVVDCLRRTELRASDPVMDMRLFKNSPLLWQTC